MWEELKKKQFFQASKTIQIEILNIINFIADQVIT